MEKICDSCKGKFETRDERRKFCSRACYIKSRTTKEEYTCISCGGKFKTNKARAINRKYCSLKCVPVGSWNIGRKLTDEEKEEKRKMMQEVVKTPEWREAHKAQWERMKIGKNNPAYKGGIWIDKEGYILLKTLGHPFANSHGYVREHRLVMEKHLGRYLKPEEVVHHINGNIRDNRTENLQLYPNNNEHIREHRISEQIKEEN